MPVHVIIGHLAVLATPAAAVLATVYAMIPRSRAGLRLPLLAVATLACALALWAAVTGGGLYDQLEGLPGATGPGTLAHAHAKAGDALAVASLVLLVLVLVLVLRFLSPRRPAAGTVHAIAAGVLVVAAVAVAWTTADTLVAALESVWSHHLVQVAP
jgi:hypothetical protein